MAFDSQGRMFVSSDLSGEIYVIVKDEASNRQSGGNGGAPNGSSGNSSGSGGKTSVAERLGSSFGTLVLALLVVCLLS